MSALDKFLVAQFLKDRSEKHFTLLYRKYSNTIYRLALFLNNHNEMMARDIVQETWITVVEKLPGFAWKSSLQTWITGILINKYRNSLRQVKTTENPGMHMSMSLKAEITAIDLKWAISQLPQGYREVIVMHDIEGFKHKEIAVLLSISEGTSKSQLFQARRQMRSLLQGYDKQQQKR